jgi:hypothetical protein
MSERSPPPGSAPVVAAFVALAAFATVATITASFGPASSAASTTAAKVPAGGTFLAGSGFADGDRAAVEGFAMELVNGALPFLGGAHGHEPESP